MMVRIHTIYPDEFPESWASNWDEDEYGLTMGFTYKGVRQDFRWIEPGTFLIGSPTDETGHTGYDTQHTVTFSRGFWLADTVVTQGLWKAFMGSNPSHFVGDNRPVECVSWYDAQSFVKKLNEMKPALNLCLPTEAQWEYACRAETVSAFSFGGKDDLNLERMNYIGKWAGVNLGGETKPVRSYHPNPWGLYDMHGNVWEWCLDRFGYYPKKLSVVDPLPMQSGNTYVTRGGSWAVGGMNCRSACRGGDFPDSRTNTCGFRLARHPVISGGR